MSCPMQGYFRDRKWLYEVMEICVILCPHDIHCDHISGNSGELPARFDWKAADQHSTF